MTEIILYGEQRCPKVRFYQEALEERGLQYELAEVDKDPQAAKQLEGLTGDASKFPTFSIAGKKLRNPKLPELDKVLARAGLYDPGLVHDEKSGRYIRHMAPSDAFVSYVWQGDRMMLTHIEVDPSLRGSGIGARFASEVFEELEDSPQEIRILCPFMRRVAASRENWKTRFNIGV